MIDKLLPPNIIITGSFRSGTTLLYLAFPHAFKDVIIEEKETYALESSLPSKYKWRVTKSPNDIHRVDIISKKFDPYFIYMIRDPRDAIVSWKVSKNDYHLNFGDWKNNFTFAKNFKSKKLIFMKFEDLIFNTNKFQDTLISKISTLEKKYDLDQCYQYINPENFIVTQLTHDSGPQKHGKSIRPIDTSVVGTWIYDKKRVRNEFEKHPDMNSILENLGYEKDDSWVKELYND